VITVNSQLSANCSVVFVAGSRVWWEIVFQ